MIKLLQTSDVHLGAKLGWLGETASAQRKQLMKTFEAITSYAIEQKVDCVLIAGDLFDSPFPSKVTASFVQTALLNLCNEGIYVFVLPGNHDRLEEGSVFMKEFITHSKCHVFSHGGVEHKTIPELDLTVYGYGIEKQFSDINPLFEVEEVLAEKKSTGTNVALVHGAVNFRGNTDTNYPINPEDINKSEFDYVALGDWHGKLDVSSGKTTAWYSGSPELLAIDQKNSGSVLEVVLDSSTVTVKSKEIGKQHVSVEEVDIALALQEKSKQDDFIRRLLQKLTIPNDDTLIRRISLTGKLPVGLSIPCDELEEILQDKYFYIRIEDSTELKVSEEELAQFPDELVIGRFIKLVREDIGKEQDPIRKKLLEDVLQEGVRRMT